MNVILVHGIFERGGLFNPLAAQLRKDGHHCLVPALKPMDARYGIADLAQKLKRYIDERLNADDQFALVGFSMGCLVCCYYLQLLGGHTRCDGLFAVSGPFAGTRAAHLLYGQGGRDLRPGSPLIRELNESVHQLKAVTIVTYRTPFDLLVIPSKISMLEAAENHVVRAPLHELMPSNRTVIQNIRNCLQKLEKLA